MNKRIGVAKVNRNIAKSSLIALSSIAIVFAFKISIDHRQTVEAQTSGICNRSSWVQSAILGELGRVRCEDVTSADLASIDFLFVRVFNSSTSPALERGDFDGLTSLEFLVLLGLNIGPFPQGQSADLANLKTLYVRDIRATTIGADHFSGLTNLETLFLIGPEVLSIDSGAFNGLVGLKRLDLRVGKLPAIDEDTFSVLGGSPQFERLAITGGAIATIAVNAFDDLSNLDFLYVQAGALITIQSGIFNGLGNLTWLILDGGSVTTISPGAFAGVGETVDDTTRNEDEDFGVIFLELNAIETLQANTFSGLGNLERLALSGDMLSTLEPDVFNGLTSLEVLYLDGGKIASVQSGVFDDLPSELRTLRLDRGGKEIFESAVLSELAGVEAIDVWDVSLTTLKSGYFNGLTTLERLYFDDAGSISRVERGAFNGLTNLRLLRLSDNRIISLPGDVFRDLTMLEEIDLSDNPLRGLPTGFVTSPPCSLETLDISGLSLTEVPNAVVNGVEVSILSTLPQPGVNGCGTDQGIRHLHMDDIPLTQADLDAIEHYQVVETLSLANTGITAEQAINVRRGQDLVTLKSLDLSNNDLSGLNDLAQRAALGVVVARLHRLEELYLASTKIDADTALVIVQNVNPNIKEFSLADNNLADWNHPDLAHDLAPAFQRFSQNWNLIDLSNTAIDSRAADSIVPHIERTHEGVPEELVEEVREARFHGGVTLDLSNNYLSRFGSGWLRNWEFLNTLDLSCNELTTVKPEWFIPVSRHLETLILSDNPLSSTMDRDEFHDVLPNLEHFHLIASGDCQHSNYSVPKSISKVLRIEPTIKEIVINPGRIVRLEVNVYGRQDLLDNSLADSVIIVWDDTHVGGSFSGIGRLVEYTAPETPGNFTITARISTEQCYGDFEQCTARFKFVVKRRANVEEASREPVNPLGQIPEILTDSGGTAYEVFTPVDGGKYIGDGFNLTASAGAVQNGDYIGISIQKGEPASNAGQTHHRFTLAGNWYQITALDSDNQPITSYQLNQSAQVCLPLPRQLRTNIHNVAIVASNQGDDSFTVLSSRVRLQPDGTPNLCANFSAIPADIAAAKRGAPSSLPKPKIDPEDQPAPPETGGRTPPVSTLLVLLTIGIAILISAMKIATQQKYRHSRP